MSLFNHSLSALAIGLLALTSTAQAVQNGPAPTLSSLTADGPYAISSQTLSGSGFGGGTVYSPNTAGKYAVVVVCPGFISGQDSMAPLSKRLASHGFVVVTLVTNTVFDFPSSRATQLLAALKAVTALKTGPVAGKIDTARQVDRIEAALRAQRLPVYLIDGLMAPGDLQRRVLVGCQAVHGIESQHGSSHHGWLVGAPANLDSRERTGDPHKCWSGNLQSVIGIKCQHGGGP